MSGWGMARGLLVALGLALAMPALAQAGGQSEQAAASVDAAFAKWDADHNGVLSLEEFRQGWVAEAQAAREAAAGAMQARLRGQFEAVDANDNQAIDAGEYPALVLVRRAGKDAPALATFDGNRDGRLQFQEYLQLVRQLAMPARAEAKP